MNIATRFQIIKLLHSSDLTANYRPDTLSMIDLRTVSTIALDIADVGSTVEGQEEITDFIWCLLDRNYKIFLVNTDNQNDLSQEDFEHPSLNILTEEMPPSEKSVETYPELMAPKTLWISDDDGLQKWVGSGEASLAHIGHHERTDSMRLNRLSELSAMLNPTRFLMNDLTAMASDMRRSQPGKPLVIGISGPPLCDFQSFAIDFQRHLQDAGFDLVELMDLSPLLCSIEQVTTADQISFHPWTTEATGPWLEEALLAPLRAGKEVFLERAPAGISPNFEPHFPFFLSKESVLLVFSELLFIREIREALDLSVLLELTPEETTRRLYEIPTNERFEAKFTEQYMLREGRVYREYLNKNRVEERASIRVDANHRGALTFISPDNPPLN